MFAEAFAARQQALSMQQDPTVTALAEAYGHSGYRGWLLKKIEILEQAPPQTVQMRKQEPRLDMFKHFGIAYLRRSSCHALPRTRLRWRQPRGTIPAGLSQLGPHPFLAPFPRPGPSHRAPAVVERQEVIRAQTRTRAQKVAAQYYLIRCAKSRASRRSSGS